MTHELERRLLASTCENVEFKIGFKRAFQIHRLVPLLRGERDADEKVRVRHVFRIRAADGDVFRRRRPRARRGANVHDIQPPVRRIHQRVPRGWRRERDIVPQRPQSGVLPLDGYSQQVFTGKAVDGEKSKTVRAAAVVLPLQARSFTHSFIRST